MPSATQEDQAKAQPDAPGRSALEQLDDWASRPPGLVESMIPVWGSARESVADFKTGHPWLGLVNAGLAASDLFVAGEVAKGGMKLAGPNTWNATRKWMGKNGVLDAGQHGHHWLIPQKGWGAKVPDIVKNQPWNIKGMPSAEVHGRIHGRYAGKPQYNLLQSANAGMPAWAKNVAVSDAMRPGMAAAQTAQDANDGED